jgi:hypothetical protein
MVCVGRKKDGSEFVVPHGLDDLLLAKGLLAYADKFVDVALTDSVLNKRG